MMTAYEIGDYPTTRRVRRVQRPRPEIGRREALIRVRATGPNARDFSIMTTGLWGGPPPPTRIPLCDVSGGVVAVGEDVTGVAPGDRVTMIHYSQWLDGAWDVSMCAVDHGQTRDGFLCEYAAVPADALVKIPDNLGYEDAATLPSAGLTAWNAVVVEGHLRPGATMVTIGTGGVSVFAMQWGKLLGARVIVTSSSDAKLDRMRALGADAGVNYRTRPKWYEGVLELTDGRGADLVVNTVGLLELDNCLEACRSGGRVSYLGATPVTGDRVAVAPPTPKRLGLTIVRDLTIKGILVGSRRMMQDMVAALGQHPEIRPIVDRVYEFDQANEALEYFAKADKIGKVVIRTAPAGGV